MINFPSNPAEGVDYTVNGKIFIWNGIGFIPKPSTSGGGHTIKDSDETFTQRTGLKFTGNVEVSDDNVNGDTIINIPAQTITVDTTLTDGSSNPIANNAVFDAFVALYKEYQIETNGLTSGMLSFSQLEKIVAIPVKYNINTLTLTPAGGGATISVITTGGVTVTLPINLAVGTYIVTLTYTGGATISSTIIQTQLQ